MSSLRAWVLASLWLVVGAPLPSMAAEAVGEAVLIKTAVTGSTGPLAVNGPVHRDERIKTSSSGLGQFVFLDGTKLAVGWGSTVVIDKFVYDGSKSVKKLSIKVAKGTFRWISGNSKSSAYEIITPAGTIGVRGTAFDVDIAPDGTTAMVLLNGSARFCGANGCRELKKRCDCIVAKRNGAISNPQRVSYAVLTSLGRAKALPFISGNQQLEGRLGSIGAGCGLTRANVAPCPQQSAATEGRSPNAPHRTSPTHRTSRTSPTHRASRTSPTPQIDRAADKPAAGRRWRAAAAAAAAVAAAAAAGGGGGGGGGRRRWRRRRRRRRRRP